MQAFYVNVSSEEQPQDMQVVRSSVNCTEEPLDVGYDPRRAIAETVCEKVLTKYNLNEVTVTIQGEGLDITLLPLSKDETYFDEDAEGTYVCD